MAADNKLRWAARNRYVNARIRQLVALGEGREKAKAQAAEEADTLWANGGEFVLPDGPPPAESSLPTAPEPGACPDDWDWAKADFRRDVAWVYSNIDRSSVTVEEAPSPGALSLLAWAREARTRFFEHLAPRVLGDASTQADGSADQATERKQVAELQEVLRKFQEVA